MSNILYIQIFFLPLITLLFSNEVIFNFASLTSCLYFFNLFLVPITSIHKILTFSERMLSKNFCTFSCLVKCGKRFNR